MSNISNLYSIGSEAIRQASLNSSTVAAKDNSFGTVLQSAIDMVKETNSLQNVAKQEEINFAIGNSQNTHDLAVAQEKAATALQYTIAVRDRFLESYKEIMNIQI